MKKAVKNIFWLYKPYWKYGKLFVIFSFAFWSLLFPFNNILDVYFPQKIIDTLGAGKPFGEVIKIAIVFKGVHLLRLVGEDAFNMFFRDNAQLDIQMNIKRDVYVQALKTDYKYIDDPKYYDRYAWAVNEYANKANDARDLIDKFSTAIITLFGLSALVALAGPWIIIITLANAVLGTFFNTKFDKLYVKKEDEFIPHDRRLGYFHRIFYQNNYAADLKNTKLKDYILANYDSTKHRKMSVMKKYAYKMLLWGGSWDIIYVGTLFILTLYVAHGIYTGDIAQVGIYITLMLAFERLNQCWYDIFNLVNDANKLNLYAEKIKAFFELKSEIEDENTNIEKIFPSDGSFAVEFKNVSFKYENSGFAISDFNLVIKPREKIAIVGENGAGKSTLVKLLLRFYDVNNGNILIDGVPIKDYNVHLLRKHIGVAFQSPNIYALPFIDNVELYNTADEEKLQSVIDVFGIDRILAKNGADLSTELTKEFSENGIMLSGGETQKIGLARLMTGNFGLLLLDEPSSALDPIAEYEMNKLILDSSNQSTTIMVAHRLSTIRDADKIVLVEQGTVKETGTHDDLMNQKGRYYEMFTKQAENYVK